MTEDTNPTTIKDVKPRASMIHSPVRITDKSSDEPYKETLISFRPELSEEGAMLRKEIGITMIISTI